MEWEDEAIIIHFKIFNEKYYLMCFLTQNYGHWKCLIKHTHILIGSVVYIHWKGKTESSLGIAKIELIQPSAIIELWDNIYALKFVRTILNTIKIWVPERVINTEFYILTKTLLYNLYKANLEAQWQAYDHYILYEFLNYQFQKYNNLKHYLQATRNIECYDNIYRTKLIDDMLLNI